MLTDWILLLVGAFIFGSAIVAAMVARRYAQPIAILTGIIGLVTAVIAFGDLTTAHPTAETGTLAVFFLLTGLTGGYWVCSAALPLLARTRTVSRLPVRSEDRVPDDRVAVIVLACTEPERYDPRAVASHQRLLVDSEALHVPATAAPFIFLSEKARYRAIGGLLPADATITEVTERLNRLLEKNPRVDGVSTAWCTSTPTLTDAITSAYARGINRVIVAPLGSNESFPVSRAKDSLNELRTTEAGMTVTFTRSMWHSTTLARRMTDRIMTVAKGVPVEAVGVVLVSEGQPPSWSAAHPDWAEQENYFVQRVRLHLMDMGLDEHRVRVAWLDWQLPDVTEAVRHLAALGCARIIVAPATIALPTLATAIDLGHGVRMARLTEAISVVTLAPWADDDSIITELAEMIESAL